MPKGHPTPVGNLNGVLYSHYFKTNCDICKTLPIKNYCLAVYFARTFATCVRYLRRDCCKRLRITDSVQQGCGHSNNNANAAEVKQTPFVQVIRHDRLSITYKTPIVCKKVYI